MPEEGSPRAEGVLAHHSVSGATPGTWAFDQVAEQRWRCGGRLAGWVAMLPLTRPPRTPPASTRGRTGGDGRARPRHGIKARCRPRAAASPWLGGGALGREAARTNARPPVLVQLVAAGAGAHGPCAAVAAAVGAAAVVRLAAIHYLHLDPCGETRHQGRGTGLG